MLTGKNKQTVIGNKWEHCDPMCGWKQKQKLGRYTNVIGLENIPWSRKWDIHIFHISLLCFLPIETVLSLGRQIRRTGFIKPEKKYGCV